MNVNLPTAPEGSQAGFSGFDPNAFAGNLEASIFKVPGVEEAVRESLIQGHGIETDYITTDASIDMTAWRQHTKFNDRFKVYLRAIVGGPIFEALLGDNAELSKERIEFLAPDFKDFVSMNRDLITTTENENVIMKGDVALQRNLGKGLALFDFIQNLGGKKDKKSKKIVQRMMNMQWPKGTTVVIPEKRASGKDHHVTAMRQILKLAGIDVNAMSPNQSGLSGPMLPGEIRVVLAPVGIPMTGGQVNTNVLDNFGKLYERGKAVWYDPKLVAATLVRMGVSVTSAIASVGLTPGFDPEKAAEYEAFVAQLGTIPVKGQVAPDGLGAPAIAAAPAPIAAPTPASPEIVPVAPIAAAAPISPVAAVPAPSVTPELETPSSTNV
jgi:hypothetical protein